VLSNPEFISELRKKIENTAMPLEAFPGILLHLRRGDYQNSDYYGLLSFEYYKNAISLIKGTNYFLVSDSVNDGLIFSKNLNIAFKDTTDLGSWELLRFMSQQKVIVSANSTLSWWAGFLAHIEGNLHYLPTPWLKNSFDEGRWLAYPKSLDLPSIFE